MKNAAIQVMFVDDHAVVRSGFHRVLEECAAIRVVAEADTGESVYRGSIDTNPDVPFFDISMPATSGRALMQRLCARAPDALR